MVYDIEELPVRSVDSGLQYLKFIQNVQISIAKLHSLTFVLLTKLLRHKCMHGCNPYYDMNYDAWSPDMELICHRHQNVEISI